MYLCGHPGTGKTSSLNYVMKLMQEEGHKFIPILFNAMTYSDVKSFGLKLYERLQESLFDELPKRLYERHQVDDEDIAPLLQRVLSRASKNGKAHRVIVIDEVDIFSRQEKAFTTIIKAILKTPGTNASVIGIANSVDLPFRKKHSAIAMREC